MPGKPETTLEAGSAFDKLDTPDPEVRFPPAVLAKKCGVVGTTGLLVSNSRQGQLTLKNTFYRYFDFLRFPSRSLQSG